MTKKKYKIKDLVLNFVSLVTEGANPEADVMLVRSTEEAMESQELPMSMFNEIIRHTEASQIQRDQLWREFKRTWEWADNPQSFLVDFSVSFGKILGDTKPTEGTPVSETESGVDKVEKEAAVEAPVERTVAEEDLSLAKEVLELTERTKKLDEEHELKLAKLEADRAEAIAAKQEIERKLADMEAQEIERSIQKEASDLGAVHGLTSDEVVSLVRMTRKNEEFKALADKLVAANRALLEDVTQEKGISVPDAVIEDDVDELSRAVRALRASEPDLSEARAVARVLQGNPSLYKGN